MIEVSRRSQRIEEFMSILDRNYAIHYENLMRDMKKKVDVVLADILGMMEQNERLHGSKNSSATFNICFKNELSEFFNWATNYPLYFLHFFLGYNEIEQYLLDKNAYVKWIDNETVEVTVCKKW